MNKGLATGLGLLVVGVIGWMVWERPTPPRVAPVVEKSPIATPKHPDTVVKKTTDSNTTKAQSVPIQVEEISQVESFELLGDETTKIAIAKKRKVEPLGAFAYPQGMIKGLAIGDKITMPEIEGVSYELEVVKRTQNSDGSITIETSISGANPSNYAIITEAKNATFVTLRSPKGVYEMEGVRGTGYIYSALEIKRAKIDYSVTDARTRDDHNH